MKSNSKHSKNKDTAQAEVKHPFQGEDDNQLKHKMDHFIDKITHGWMPYVLISIIGFLVYANTLNHEYALDDEMIICQNISVTSGLQGIPAIFKSDIFKNYNATVNEEDNLAGGRYRPFSVATFAIEQQFIGVYPDGIQANSWDENENNIQDANEDRNHDGLFDATDAKVKGMAFRHFNNVCLYVLSVCLLFFFLSTYFLKEQKLVALLAMLLFLVHPIHTEVVANIKSRDEILSLLFITLTLIFGFRYMETKKTKMFLYLLFSFFLALLSKEYGVTLLIILPISLYIYHKDFNWKSESKVWIGLVLTFIIYFVIRSNFVAGMQSNALQNMDLQRNPYLFASTEQAWATKIFINLKYIGLLLLPLQLCSDYNYISIPYKTFKDFEVWLSLIVLLGLFIACFWAFRKKSWLLFPLMFIVLHLFLINNTFFDIGATMGERLVYHSSLGVCILIVFGLQRVLGIIIQKENGVLLFLVLPLVLFYSFKTIQRNPAWKNNLELFTTDVQSYPNNFILNASACNSLFHAGIAPVNATKKEAMLQKAIFYGNKSLSINPKLFLSHVLLGQIYMHQLKDDSAVFHWLKAREIAPTDQSVNNLMQMVENYYYPKGVKSFEANQFSQAIQEFSLAIKINPKDINSMYYLGQAFIKVGNSAKAKEIFQSGLKIDSNSINLKTALKEIESH